MDQEKDTPKEEPVKAEKPAPPPPPPPPKNPVEDDVLARFKDAVQTRYNFNDLEITVEPAQLLPLCQYLFNHPKVQYDYLRNHTAVDWKDRFELVYHLCATSNMNNIIVKTSVGREDPAVESVTKIWGGADWQEREVFDLFGVRYRGHHYMRRILLPDEWEGHPLRKDYKVVEKEVESWKQAYEQKN
jgi:NADH-quinone oxidoreductase subunit C